MILSVTLAEYIRHFYVHYLYVISLSMQKLTAAFLLG
jgi:hypothetical protein